MLRPREACDALMPMSVWRVRSQRATDPVLLVPEDVFSALSQLSRAGEMLDEMEKATGGQPYQSQAVTGRDEKPPTRCPYPNRSHGAKSRQD